MPRRFLTIDSSDWRDFLRELKEVAPELRRAFVKEIRSILSPVVADAKSHAPYRTGKLRRGVRSSVRASSVAIVSTAEHGRQKEFGGRHPLYGNREFWYEDKATPYIMPAIQRHESSVDKAASIAMVRAAGKAKFK